MGVVVVAITMLLVAATETHAPTTAPPIVSNPPDQLHQVRDAEDPAEVREPETMPTNAEITAVPSTTSSPEPAEEVPGTTAAPVPATPAIFGSAPAADLSPQKLAMLITRVAAELSVETSINPAGIVLYTNAQRALKGQSPLTRNAVLDEMAAAKLDDLFARQYFAHESPDGADIVDLARTAGYGYRLLGENLALGDFATTQTVVDTWMESDAHRANILNPDFTEIGVAARFGRYKEWNTWIVVQEFGTPCTQCIAQAAAASSPASPAAAAPIAAAFVSVEALESKWDLLERMVGRWVQVLFEYAW